jgi:hypothetical protein
MFCTHQPEEILDPWRTIRTRKTCVCSPSSPSHGHLGLTGTQVQSCRCPLDQLFSLAQPNFVAESPPKVAVVGHVVFSLHILLPH